MAAHGPHSIVLLGFHRVASAFLHDLETTRPDLLEHVHVVDFNPDVLHELHRRGISCAEADLSSPDTLRHVGIGGAKVAVCTIPDTLLKRTTNRRLLAAVRDLCPGAATVGTAETRDTERDLLADGAAAVIVPPRAAAASVLSDVLALLEGRPVPGRDAGDTRRPEVLR